MKLGFKVGICSVCLCVLYLLAIRILFGSGAIKTAEDSDASGEARPASVDRHYALSEAQAVTEPKPQLSVDIVINEVHDRRSIALVKEHQHFHVIVTNVSDEPVRLWQEWCSWGYKALSFLAKVPGGNEYLFRKKSKVFEKNFPSWLVLASEEHYVIDVYIQNEDIWEGVPCSRRGQSHTYDMQAIFEIKADKETREYGIWVGRITSSTERVTLGM